MNKKQKTVLWIGVTVLVIIGLFPPWVQTWNLAATSGETTLGFHFINRAPAARGRFATHSGVRISSSQMIVQGALVVFIFGGMILALIDKD